MPRAQDFANRVPITVGLMLATVMNSLDTTIANVALPHMAGSVSASPGPDHLGPDLLHHRRGDHDAADRLAVDRIGRKRMFLISIAGFTIASMLCGVSRAWARSWSSACCRACAARR
jgi:DHA2 family multidrug resistance protein